MNWTLFFSFLVVGFLALFLYRFAYQRQVIKLQYMLYSMNDTEGYLAELESPTSRFLLATDLRKLLSIDAYLAQGNNEKLEELFDKVENGKLKKGDHFTVLQKEVSHYCSTYQKQKAIDAYNKMKEIYPSLKSKDNHYEIALKEVEYEVEIIMNHNDSYAEELVQKAKEITNKIPSGVYYYRAAQCYYFRNDLKKCEECLEKAEVKLRGTGSSDKLKEILKKKDFKQLEREL